MGRLIILYAYLGIGPRLYIITEKVVLSSLGKNKDSNFRSLYLIIAKYSWASTHTWLLGRCYCDKEHKLH